MNVVSSVVVALAMSAVTCAFPGYYFDEPVYNQYTGPYPNLVRYVRSPADSSSFSSASSSSSSGGGTTSGTFMNPGPGGSGSFNAFAGNTAPNFGFPPFGYGFGGPQPYFNNFDFLNFLQQYFNQLQASAMQAQAHAQEAANKGGFPGGDVVGGAATAQYSPSGGYGAAAVYPSVEGGIDNRFGAESPGSPVNSVSGSLPPGSNGIFTSSSSGFSDVNGVKTSFKQASVGVNKDGKVTTYTAHSP